MAAPGSVEGLGLIKLRPTPLAGAVVAESRRMGDTRGWFARLFCEAELATILAGRRIVQINQSSTSLRGTVRGLHFQYAPHAEMKFVRCLRGRVWDVAVDLRTGSPTFLQWHAEELSSDSARMYVIPEGFAHGFQSLEPDSELLYLHTAAYTPEAEGGVDCRDPMLGIDWPLPVAELSPRDSLHPPLGADFKGVAL